MLAAGYTLAVSESTVQPPSMDVEIDVHRDVNRVTQMDSLGSFIEAEWKLPLGTRVALVVRQDVGFGLGRMFSMMNDEKLPFAYQVFRERSEAESWISSE